MNYRYIVLLLLILVSLLIGYPIISKSQIQNIEKVYLDVLEENLRSTPNGKKIGTLVKGTELEKVDQQGNWTKVKVEGWIWKPSIRSNFNKN